MTDDYRNQKTHIETFYAGDQTVSHYIFFDDDRVECQDRAANTLLTYDSDGYMWKGKKESKIGKIHMVDSNHLKFDNKISGGTYESEFSSRSYEIYLQFECALTQKYMAGVMNWK